MAAFVNSAISFVNQSASKCRKLAKVAEVVSVTVRV